MKTTNTRISTTFRLTEDIHNLAKQQSELNSRSVAGQIDWWVKIAVVVENQLSHEEIQDIIKKFPPIKEKLLTKDF